jgi:hypothetical protein
MKRKEEQMEGGSLKKMFILEKHITHQLSYKEIIRKILLNSRLSSP